VTRPNADIGSITVDYLTDFLDEEVRRTEERANEKATEECLVDDEKPSREIAVILPIFLLMII
jgi:hypothetical protein